MTASQTIVFAGEAYTYEQLYNLGGPALVKLHNEAGKRAGVEPTKRFADKTAAVKRTWAVLQKVEPALNPEEAGLVKTAPSELAKPLAAPEPEAPKPDPKPAKAPKQASERTPRGRYFHFPAAPVDEQKKPKATTFRGKLFQLMSRQYGATFEQMLAATWGEKADMDDETKDKTCYEAIRLVNKFNGYGIFHSSTDHLFVWSTKAEYAEIAKNNVAKKDADK